MISNARSNALERVLARVGQMLHITARNNTTQQIYLQTIHTFVLVLVLYFHR